MTSPKSACAAGAVLSLGVNPGVASAEVEPTAGQVPGSLASDAGRLGSATDPALDGDRDTRPRWEGSGEAAPTRGQAGVAPARSPRRKRRKDISRPLWPAPSVPRCPEEPSGCAWSGRRGLWHALSHPAPDRCRSPRRLLHGRGLPSWRLDRLLRRRPLPADAPSDANPPTARSDRPRRRRMRHAIRVRVPSRWPLPPLEAGLVGRHRLLVAMATALGAGAASSRRRRR